MNELWRGLRESAKQQLKQRDYRVADLSARISGPGVEVGELLKADRQQLKDCWIPGVEFLPRRIFPQRHRGFFGELARRDEGALVDIGLWPAQWATATMFANTAKGFHIHPPFTPSSMEPSAWFKKLYIDEPSNFSLRPYEQEQWDVMFFIQGVVEMVLVDERAGLDRRTMRFLIEGDNHRGPNNAAVVIPPGVAHALRVEGSADVVMVYGTSTKFNPDYEGRIASEIESAPLIDDWEKYIQG